MRVRYVSRDEDSARWDHVELCAGDVIVSTRSKHGTTWVQAILLMLVHGPDLPAPLAELSPWIDHLVEPIEQVADRLAAQPHRRVMKTHTPLDGLPSEPAVHRVVVARHPLDAAVSLYHQSANLDRQQIARLTGSPATAPAPRPDVGEWLGRWVRARSDPSSDLDSLDGVFHHLADAWARRHDPAVTLVHYTDLQEDLTAQVRRLAGAVDLPFDDRVPAGATFASMRRRADRFAPDAHRLLCDQAAFFRRGRSGDGVAAISARDLEHYRQRARAELGDELVAWLHR